MNLRTRRINVNVCAIGLGLLLLCIGHGCAWPQRMPWTLPLSTRLSHWPPHRPVPTVDRISYGYAQTCWRPWSGEIVESLTEVIETHDGVDAVEQGETISSGGADLLMIPANELPVDDDSPSREILITPEAEPTEESGEPLPPPENEATPQNEATDAETPPFRDEEMPPDEGGSEIRFPSESDGDAIEKDPGPPQKPVLEGKRLRAPKVIRLPLTLRELNDAPHLPMQSLRKVTWLSESAGGVRAKTSCASTSGTRHREVKSTIQADRISRPLSQPKVFKSLCMPSDSEEDRPSSPAERKGPSGNLSGAIIRSAAVSPRID